jgi:hypothetical protein
LVKQEVNEVAKSDTALRAQGRYLLLEGGRDVLRLKMRFNPCDPFASAMDCCAVLSFQVER